MLQIDTEIVWFGEHCAQGANVVCDNEVEEFVYHFSIGEPPTV